MKYPIIVLCGQAGAGKDTCAEMLAEGENAVIMGFADALKRICVELTAGRDSTPFWGPSANRNAIVSLRYDEKTITDALKEHGVLKFLTEGKLAAIQSHLANYCQRRGTQTTARELLQKVGSIFRAFKPDLWVKVLLDSANAVLSGECYYDRGCGCNAIVGHYQPDFVIVTDGRYRNEVLAIKGIGGEAVLVEAVRNKSIDSTHSSETEIQGVPNSWFYCTIENDFQNKSWKRNLEQQLLELRSDLL